MTGRSGGRHRAPSTGPSRKVKLVAFVLVPVLLLTLGAMLVATIPPSDTPDPWLFRFKVIGGAALFVFLGGIVFWRGRRRDR